MTVITLCCINLTLSRPLALYRYLIYCTIPGIPLPVYYTAVAYHTPTAGSVCVDYHKTKCCARTGPTAGSYQLFTGSTSWTMGAVNAGW